MSHYHAYIGTLDPLYLKCGCGDVITTPVSSAPRSSDGNTAERVAVGAGDKPRSEVDSVGRAALTSDGNRASLQYDRKGDGVMVSNATADKKIETQPADGFSHQWTDRARQARVGHPDGPASSPSAPAPTAPAIGTVARGVLDDLRESRGDWICGSKWYAAFTPTYAQRISLDLRPRGYDIESRRCEAHYHRGAIHEYRLR